MYSSTLKLFIVVVMMAMALANTMDELEQFTESFPADEDEDEELLGCGSYGKVLYTDLYNVSMDFFALDPITCGVDETFMVIATKMPESISNDTLKDVAMVTFLDNELVGIHHYVKNPGVMATTRLHVSDWYRPMQSARSVCALLTNITSGQPLFGVSSIAEEYRLKFYKFPDPSTRLDEELKLVLGKIKHQKRLIVLGRSNGVAELLQQKHSESSGDMDGGVDQCDHQWTAIHFDFAPRSQESRRNEGNNLVMTINIGSCEEDEECVWSIIADTLKSVENADEPWDLLNVEMASCPDTVIQRIINLAKPKVVRVVYPGAIPLGIDMKVSFDSRLEPLQRPAIESGGYGCSLSHLWSLVTPMGYDLDTCTRKTGRNKNVTEFENFNSMAQTRAAIFIQTSNTNFEFGSHSKALVTCTKPYYNPRCDGLKSELILYPEVICERIGVEFMKNKTRTIEKLEQSLQTFISAYLGGDHMERRAVECRESSVLWEDILNSSSGEKEGELAWMFKASALVSSVIGTNPLSIRSIELDSQLYPDSLNQLIKKLEHLSSSLSNNNNNHHQDIIIYQPAVSSGFRIENAHFSIDKMHLMLTLQLAEDDLLEDLDFALACIVVLSGPAVAATAAIILGHDGFSTAAKFPSSLPPGRYIVEVVEQVRGEWNLALSQWRPRYWDDRGVRHEIGVIEIQSRNILGFDSSNEFWIPFHRHDPDLLRNISCPQHELVHPHWHWATHHPICANDAFQCLLRRQGPIFFIGDSHVRDLFVEALSLTEKFLDPFSNARKWFRSRFHNKHDNMTVSFPGNEGSHIAFIFSRRWDYISENIHALSDDGVQVRTEKLSDHHVNNTLGSDVQFTLLALGPESTVIISAGMWVVELDDMKLADMKLHWNQLSDEMDRVWTKWPTVKIILLTIPTTNSRTAAYIALLNSELKRYFWRRHPASMLSIVDYYALTLADTNKQWSDLLHVGVTCWNCDRRGRPIARTTMSLIASQLCLD